MRKHGDSVVGKQEGRVRTEAMWGPGVTYTMGGVRVLLATLV